MTWAALQERSQETNTERHLQLMVDISLLVRDLVLFLGLALLTILITRKLVLPYTLGLVLVGLVVGFIGSPLKQSFRQNWSSLCSCLHCSLKVLGPSSSRCCGRIGA